MTNAISRKTLIALAAIAGLAVTAAAAVFFGIFSVERRVGYFAPVWDPDGRHVYVLERETRGVVWGFGWENFSPPASSYVSSDRLSLQRLDSETSEIETLEAFEGSPVQGRVTKHYRGRIFGSVAARLAPRDDGVEFQIRLDVPRVPSSEQWSLRGTWAAGRPSGAEWSDESSGSMTAPEEVLADGVEVMTVPGYESFPAAVLAVDADGEYRVLLQAPAFAELYPEGVPPEKIEERSNRWTIQRAQDFRFVKEKLVARFLAQGLGEGEASLRAYAEMEARGYLPKSPRLVATRVESLPDDVRVFEVTEGHFRVGLFQDIGSALATPGIEVETATGTYLKYGDDDLGPRLRAWREDGHDRFGVRSEGRLYLLEVRRFDR